MVDKISFENEAIKELDKAKCFFDSLNLADEFLDDFENQVALIRQMPYGFQIRYKNIRIIKFQKFSFTIHYIVLSESEIIIVNILNQSQDF